MLDGIGGRIPWHLHTHGADIIQKRVEIISRQLVGLEDTETLETSGRFHEGTKRANEAAEEAGDVQAWDDSGNQKSHLDPGSEACCSKDTVVPHHHPGDVGEESTRRRKDGERRVREHSQRILLSGGGTAPTNKNGREQ